MKRAQRWVLGLSLLIAASVAGAADVTIGVGDGEAFACASARDQARDVCATRQAGLASEDISECRRNCEWREGKFHCSFAYRCAQDAYRGPTRQTLSAEASRRLPESLNPCDSARRLARREVRERCEDIGGFLVTDSIHAPACDCRSAGRFVGDGERSEHCTARVSAQCDTSQ